MGEDRPVVAVVLKSSLMIFSSMSSSSWEEEWDTEREAGCSRNVCCRNVYTIYMYLLSRVHCLLLHVHCTLRELILARLNTSGGANASIVSLALHRRTHFGSTHASVEVLTQYTCTCAHKIMYM